MMTLKRFRVTDFKSVDDRGWIDTNDVTALIGTNEAGKTNVVLRLWKFNPAKEGAIVPTSDYPRKMYSTFRHQKPKPVFIRTIFEVDDDLARELSDATGMPVETIRTVEVARSFDGEFDVDFPDAVPARTVERERVLTVLENADRDIGR
jgi:ABC-type branched-subunit amino acid transport system ATPase component